ASGFPQSGSLAPRVTPASSAIGRRLTGRVGSPPARLAERVAYFFAVSGVGAPSHAPGNCPRGALIGGLRKTLATTASIRPTVPSARTYFTTSAAAGGIINCHRHTPTSSTQLIGRKYCRHVIITWSIRSRGSDHRIHIITSTRNQHLPTNTVMFSRFPSQKPHSRLGSKGKKPVCQPPKNSSVASPLTA